MKWIGVVLLVVYLGIAGAYAALGVRRDMSALAWPADAVRYARLKICETGPQNAQTTVSPR
jgi:hypothetical protein